MVKLLRAAIAIVLLATFIATPKTVKADNLTFGPNIRVSDTPPTGSNNIDGPPILDVDVGSNVDVAWIDHLNGSLAAEVYYSRLTGGSSDFSDNKPLSGVWDIKSFPQIETDAGNIYVAWGEYKVINNATKSGIWFTKSTDGGQTFNIPLFIGGNVAPFSMTAHDGKILIAYAVSGDQILLASSGDGGTNFVQASISSGFTTGAQRPAIDFKGNNVYVFWLDSRNGKYDVFFNKSSDGGASFGLEKSVYANPENIIHLLGGDVGRLSEKISVNGTIYLAFDFFLQPGINSTANSDVFFIKSTDGGQNFSTAIRLSSDPINSYTSQEKPSLTILPDGSPAIAWQDRRDGPDKAMLVYSQDQGQTFSPNIVISNTAPNFNLSSAPTIAADNDGNIHFVRMDNALSPSGVYYTKIGLGLNPVPSPTPSPSPTPVVAPFLDLPWDYQSKGQTFNDAAMSITSYFDHEYPMLSAGLPEPIQIVRFNNPVRSNFPYTSHDGYDYARDADVNLGDPVLAAGNGCASYTQFADGNNVIEIDHGNGYQTRYLHLGDNNLITKSSNCVQVQKGQKIGEVGFSGHTIPQGPDGAHIHFMVIQDKNHDGNFEDNIPDGVTDPFGWQNTEPDPWPNYQFTYTGEQRTGNKSYYLWTKNLTNLNPDLDSNGGVFQTERYNLQFPTGATDKQLRLEIKTGPTANKSDITKSIGSTISVVAKDLLGNIVDHFDQPFTLTVSYDTFNLDNYNAASVRIYSSQDGTNWTPEETTLDFGQKTASANINHLTHFALMVDRLDIVPPTTTATLSGTQGKPDWFRSNVSTTLNATDNLLGTDYTLYSADGANWSKYATPLTFNTEGQHKIQFFSVDKDGNEEQAKTVEFNIDKVAPEAKIFVDQDKQDLVVKGTEDPTTITLVSGKNLQKTYTITDSAGNTVKLDVLGFDAKKLDNFNLYSIAYNQGPPIIVPSNAYTVLYNGKPSKLNVKEQYFKLKNVIRARITYDKSKDKSTIYTLQGNSLKQKEIRNGLVLLQLKTNQGNLEYSY
jgi:murein DD-endopeptidase MepM/ murein hydrolase activator NlpD